MDLDSPQARQIARRYLPPTDMKDSRPHEEYPTHYWYRVTDIPPHLTARKMKVAGNLGGPKTLRFKKTEEKPDAAAPSGKKTQVEILGTGAFAAVPPSRVEKKGNKKKYERRIWRETLGQPAMMDAQTLYNCVLALALACGFDGPDQVSPPKPKPPANKRKPETTSCKECSLPLPTGETALQARTYVAKIHGSVIGENGNGHTYYVARVLVNDFGLSVEDALPLFC